MANKDRRLEKCWYVERVDNASSTASQIVREQLGRAIVKVKCADARRGAGNIQVSSQCIHFGVSLIFVSADRGKKLPAIIFSAARTDIDYDTTSPNPLLTRLEVRLSKAEAGKQGPISPWTLARYRIKH